MPISRRTTLALVSLLPLLAGGCLAITEPPHGPDCITLATTLASVTDLQATASGLRFRDLIVGSGSEVTSGSRVAVNYSACTTEGLVFSEVPAPSLFTFSVGQGQVIAGLDEGVTGMRVGGRRQLVIPPELAYGTNGSPGGFLVPNATVVMTVDAIAVR